MKVAIVHDYIKEYGGAERVLEALIKLYPDADIYTSLYAPEYLGPHKKRFENYTIKTTWLNSIPGRHKLISPLRLLSPFAFRKLNLTHYDAVIVSQTGAYFPNLVHHKKGKLICYTHTPPRYLYGYKTGRNMPKNPIIRAMAAVGFNALRIVDFNASKNVDVFIANSEEIKGRIKKFYRRDALVIYPPVAVPNVVANSFQLKTNSYYVTGGRLAASKGIDVIIKAFNENGKPLKIFGKGFAGIEDALRKLSRKNIEFVGEVSDEQKFELLANAKAFVFASYDEDFGITPVEAMGVGTPVIAYASGGVKETVIEGKTGVFYNENTPESLNGAILKFEKMTLNQNDCVERAEKFSQKEFDRKIREVVDNA
jgi:glycosyltransferase involved in cell wall biosynthesis